jgi:hypothetical protein
MFPYSVSFVKGTIHSKPIAEEQVKEIVERYCSLVVCK